jgi:hypothetical protein
MRLSANFTLAEFIKSQTATRKGLDNTPGPEHLANAKELFENVVQKVRENFGVTVINSGYRGQALNEAVGGSSNSQHCKGEAVDIECPGTGNYTRHLTEGKYKCQSRGITGLLSDSGGGIPAAAKVLLEVRRPCTMHTVDTAVGWAMGEKDKKPKSDEE